MNDEWDRQKDIDAEGQRAMMVPRKPDLSNVGKATAYKMGYRQAQATLTTPDQRTAALVVAARQMLIEYDEFDLDHAEPKSMTDAVFALRAALAAWEA